jgi:ABC-2 type transport system permease protein
MTAALARHATVPGRAAAFAGTWELVRLIVRRDRVALGLWVILMAALPTGLVSAVEQGYPTEADRAAFAVGAAVNPAELATRGPVFAATVGGLTAWTIASSAVLLGGVVNILLVVRHTRAEEQAGRRELVGAGVLGRYAPLAAALVVVTVGNLAIAALVTAGLAAAGLPAAGGVALGMAIAAGGLLFAAVGAVAAQVAEGTGAANGIGFAVLGALFAVAAAGEVSRSWLVWLSPFGWSRRVQAFAGEQWAVFGLFALATAVLVVAAFVLSARRDVGAGLLAARPGPARAAPGLRSPIALTWRLARGGILAWTAGLTLLGLLLGAAMASIGDQLDTAAFRDLTGTLGGGDPAEVFFRFILYVLAQVVTAFGLATVLEMRSQETGGLTDLVLATPVRRAQWAIGHVAVAATGVVVGLAGLGLGAGVGYGTPLAVIGTTLAYVPACLLFAGLAMALYGWALRLAGPVTWTVFGLVLLLDLVGEFGLADASLLGLSPFVRTLGPLTVGDGLAEALLVISLIAVALVAVGLAGLARRDLG